MRQIKFDVLHTGFREGLLFAVGEMPVIAEFAFVAGQRVGGQAVLVLD